MPGEWDAQQRMIDYDRKLAEQLAADRDIPQGQMVSGVYVAPSWTQQLAKALNPLLARKQLDDVNNRQRVLDDTRMSERSTTMQAFAKALQGTPEQVNALPPDQAGPPQIIPAVPGNRNEAMNILGQSRDPMLQQLYMAQALKGIEPGEAFTLGAGQKRFKGDGTVVAEVAPKTEKPFIRTRVIGEQEVQEQLQPDGTYQEIGRGPRFARQVAPVVNVGQGGGKAPAGYRFTASGDLEAIPGGPADAKKQGQLNADTASMQAAESAMGELAVFANELKNAPGLKGITGLRGAIPNIPGSDAANAQAKLETLKSKVAFGVLQAMRDASKTGGALGAVSEKELMLLQNNLAALDKAQSFEEFQRSLDGIIAYTEQAKGRIRNAYNMKHGGGNALPATTPGGGTGGFKIIGVE